MKIQNGSTYQRQSDALSGATFTTRRVAMGRALGSSGPRPASHAACQRLPSTTEHKACMQGCTGLTDEAASSAAQSLSTLTNLMTLSMENHYTNANIAAFEGTVSIAHAVIKLSKLAHLHITASSLTMEERQGIKEILQRPASLSGWLEMWWKHCAVPKAWMV